MRRSFDGTIARVHSTDGLAYRQLPRSRNLHRPCRLPPTRRTAGPAPLASAAGAVPYKEPGRGKEYNVADESPRRSAARPEEELELREILQVEVPRDRVERLKGLTRVDDPNVTEEVFDYLIRQQAQSVNIQYARFLSGVQFTE